MPNDELAYLRLMKLIRAFEERVDRLFVEARIHGTTHLCIGQEAVPVGACAAVRPTDLASGSHRGHGLALAKGLDVKRLMAELLGRRDGYCQGKGGTQHVASLEHGFLGTNGITGGGIPVATGAALAAKLRRTGQVVLSFFGDGASNQGTFHESLNMAAVWRLPIVYVCENNLYAMSTPLHEATAVERIAARAAAYGMPGETVDGNDVLEVREAVRRAAERARAGGGPTLLECTTYRHVGHSKSDEREYRTREEEQCWLALDPILRSERRLEGQGALSAEALGAMNADVAAELDAAVAFAEASPPLDPRLAAEGVYAE
ncbi:MAG TPA: thiamine pyrophosphate-dependent dehydrogenase E1 component subunit alpha [Planctomycetota bacterium]|nr:thiamine pyrophosphate-dependent dehydrogenase E1 component subunit alpha [Planctomycetota bacterium]HRR83035.1 thiamine pyrophosphate-dependent dehydrogenase E1 component subunit alpha [Planctomycetota bacterium]HRT94985.1 thiamine pyrophosphate-dependent dehydrogenase E1 component subunit alpha [Planctomycetota bacterium]